MGLGKNSCRFDFRIYPPSSLVTVTLTSYTYAASTTGHTFTPYRILNAREERVEDGGELLFPTTASTDGLTAADGTVWLLWQSMLDNVGAPTPKPTDVIVGPDNQRWTIMSVTHKLIGNCHRCVCTRVK